MSVVYGNDGKVQSIVGQSGSEVGFTLTANHADEHAAMFFNSTRVFEWTNFVPRIIASLVTSSTAAQSGTTVTVTATAHGIPSGGSLEGFTFYYPGSASIAAGWYPGFSRVDANTITFTYPLSQTVSSESVNAGAAYTTATTMYSLTLPGGIMGANGECEMYLAREGGATAASKLIQLNLAGSIVCRGGGTTTSSSLRAKVSFNNVGATNKQQGQAVVDGTAAAIGSLIQRTVDMTADQLLELVGSVSAAADYLVVTNSYVMVKP